MTTFWRERKKSEYWRKKCLIQAFWRRNQEITIWISNIFNKVARVKFDKKIISDFFVTSASDYYRYLLRFFDWGAHETMYAHIGNKHFFTKSCHCQTYQNSKISWQKMPISDFQSDFSMSKIIRIFLKKIFIEEYQFRGTYIVIGIFWKLQFLKPFISKIKHIFCQLILEFW